MLGKEKISFKCTIKSVNEKVPPLANREKFTEENEVLLKLFIAKIRQDYKLDGDITVHRAHKSNKGDLACDQEIITTKLALTKDEDILVLYDRSIKVAPGGAGTGANVHSTTGKSVLALGGIGTGGEIDDQNNMMGGSGVGGDGEGEGVAGSAGKGWGGNAVPLEPGAEARAGDGVGGDLKRKPRPAFAHKPKKLS